MDPAGGNQVLHALFPFVGILSVSVTGFVYRQDLEDYGRAGAFVRGRSDRNFPRDPCVWWQEVVCRAFSALP
jgi:hypothetical protein